MRVIGIDTSTQATGLCCIRFDASGDFTVEGHRVIDQARTRAEAMLPSLSEMLSSAGLRLTDADAIAIAVGPGSFTGLRIGVTIAKTMAQFADKALYGVSTLEAMAFGHRTGRIICPIIDARADRIFSAAYLSADARPKLLIPEGLYYESDLEASLNKLTHEHPDAALCFIGAGMKRHESLICAFDGRCTRIEGAQGASPVLAAARIAALRHAEGDADDCFTLSPNYLRKSQAEMDRSRT